LRLFNTALDDCERVLDSRTCVPGSRTLSRGIDAMPRKPLIQPWTAEDSALLAKLLREGKSYDQIARHMKRTASAVREHSKRLRESEWRRGGRG